VSELLSDDSTESRQFGMNDASLLMLTMNLKQFTTNTIDQRCQSQSHTHTHTHTSNVTVTDWQSY